MTNSTAALLEECKEALRKPEGFATSVYWAENGPRLLRALVGVLQQQTDQETEGDQARVDGVPDKEHGDLPRPAEGRRDG